MSEEPATVSVLVPVAVGRPYTYAVPEGMSLAPGDVVRVPLGPRGALGVVWDDAPEPVAAARLRTVDERLGARIDGDMRRFVDWVADYTLSARGMVLRMVLRTPEALVPERPLAAVRATGLAPARVTAARERVLAVAADGVPRAKSALAAEAGVSASVVEGLVEAGALANVLLSPPQAAVPDPGRPGPGLSAEQAEAARSLRETLAEGRFSVTLLEGVTGAGKTEVYFEAVAEALRGGRQALVLVPEISLTSQFLERFAARFGAPPAEWHSQVPGKARERVWRGVASGDVHVVAGARSALFLPFQRPGLVVVDEEHDAAYKQEDGVTYHARDMAVVRGMIGGFPVVLSSATPSVESRANVIRGRYRHVALPDRFGGALPAIRTVDMRRDGPERGRWLSPALVTGMGETLGQGRQALLFLNRRGYAPLTLCRRCGYRFACPNCSAWLVEHRFRGELSCHHCGHHVARPPACPACGEADSLVACGPGVERVAEEAKERFPDARLVILSSDLIGGLAELRARFSAIERGEADIVVGTQLVAKGHNFPRLALVGVVDADIGLAGADPRAAERTFQLLQQVTGRAGRTQAGGTGILQTFDPDHPVMGALASGSAEAFYARELASREAHELPPFGRMAALVVSARRRDAALNHARALAANVPHTAGIRVLGPGEAPLAVLRGRHRFRLLVRASRETDLQGFLRRWLAAAPAPAGGAKVAVDVDPMSFL